ncbi:F-box protein [Zea mays]|uniref:F-box protein n=2 Tax=Zea mays TaxID=4577 RepID=A0A1Q1BFJ5_MAIZE|nr:F-box protein [Zea mays]
MHSLVAAGLVC